MGLEPSHRRQIEDLLGRELTDAELATAPSLAELSSKALAVARTLARKQLVLCTLYLRVATLETMASITRFIDELSSGKDML